MVSPLLKPECQDDPKGFQNTTKTQPPKNKPTCDGLGATVCIYWINILIRHLVEFTRILSELWRQTSSNAIRREKSQHFASQQPKFTLPLKFLPLHQLFSSTQIVHQISVSLLYPSIWAVHILYLFCNHFPFSWHSTPAGRTVRLSCSLLLIGSLWSFPHPPPLLAPPSPCKTHKWI